MQPRSTMPRAPPISVHLTVKVWVPASSTASEALHENEEAGTLPVLSQVPIHIASAPFLEHSLVKRTPA